MAFGLNPQDDWRQFGGQALQDLGYGLSNSPTIGTALGAANRRTQEQQPYRDQQATLAEQQRQDALEKNQTSEWIKANFPQYSNLPPQQAWTAAMADLAAKRQAASGGGATYGQTPVFLVDDKGNQQAAQMSSGGGLLVNGKTLPGIPTGWKVVARPDNMSSVDMGGYRGVFDPNSGTYSGGPAIQGAPSANMDVTQQGDGTRQMAPAAGSPQAIENIGNRTKAATALNTLETKNQIAANAIDKALTQASWATTGLIGGATSGVGGSPAFDLAKTLETIKANIGFDELQTMRDNSPTGGALGQVTERELAFLQSTIANIEQAQSEQQLRDNLKVLKDYLSMSTQQRRSAFDQQFGGAGAPAAPAGQSTSTGVQWSFEP